MPLIGQHELARILSAKADVSPASAKRLIQAFTELMGSALAAGHTVTIPRLGRFEPRLWRRSGLHNVFTGAWQQPTQSWHIHFQAAAMLKHRVNKRQYKHRHSHPPPGAGETSGGEKGE